MLSTACEQFLGKSEEEIHNIALVTLEGHQRAIMGSMTVEVSTFFTIVINQVESNCFFYIRFLLTSIYSYTNCFNY